MPLPMVHLSIAQRMIQRAGIEEQGAFLLGNISPDAIHMRENAEREDKWKTHFYVKEATDTDRFIRETIIPFLNGFPAGHAAAWFARGYAAHVLTDLMWLHSVFSEFRSQTEQAHIEDHRTLYYQETDQIDFNFFHYEPWRPAVWSHLEQTPSIDVPSILSSMEVEKWKIRTLRWFTEISKEPKIEPQYITEKKVRNFIEQTADRLLVWFEREKYI
jgi:hypothetical protein